MELKKTVGIVVGIVVALLMFTAGGKNEYKKKKNLLPFCVPIIFTGHEICIRPYTPKSSNKLPKRQVRAPVPPLAAKKDPELERLTKEHEKYHNDGKMGRNHQRLHNKISTEHKKELHKNIRSVKK